MSTFIVETDERTWRAAGMDASTAAAQDPGATDDYSRRVLGELFAEHLRGAPLIGNNSKWNAFPVVRNDRWFSGSRVLLGDAAHTAHFSVGSGTKLAMEDAIALARALGAHATAGEAFAAYQRSRRLPVERTQAWAARSMRWWETFGGRLHLPPRQLGLHYLTRTGAIDWDGFARRHPERLAEAAADFAGRAVEADRQRGGPARSPKGEPDTRPDHAPLWLGTLRLANRYAARLTGPAPEQAATAGELVRRGNGLVLADWRELPPGPGIRAWRDAADEVRAAGGALALITGPAPAAAVRLAVAVGADAIELAGGANRTNFAEDVLRRAVAQCDGRLSVWAGMPCPVVPIGSAEGDILVARCRALREGGATALHLHNEAAGEAGLMDLLDWADLLRAEVGLPVLVDVAGRPEEAGALAPGTLISGRADVVVTVVGSDSVPAAVTGAASRGCARTVA